MIEQLIAAFLERLPAERRPPVQQRLNRLRRPAWLGTLRRTTPLSQNFGFDRGWPVDRYYMDRFLAEHRGDIRGRVLEVKEGRYTAQYGVGVDAVDVLDIDAANPHATIVADLARLDPAGCADRFDCFVLTQTLHLIYDVRAALSGAHMLLRPGGVLLATIPAVSRIVPRHEGVTDYWRLTVPSATALFGEAFGSAQVQARSYGNVLAAIAFLAGMAGDELSRDELDVNDPEMPVLIAVRAVKATSGQSTPQ
jgi:SAM-dependent methyltransferase